MSFDLNEAVFDEPGSYLEEKAVRYEEALMDQFAQGRFFDIRSLHPRPLASGQIL
jgi:hypothetical protein